MDVPSPARTILHTDRSQFKPQRAGVMNRTTASFFHEQSVDAYRRVDVMRLMWITGSMGLVTWLKPETGRVSIQRGTLHDIQGEEPLPHRVPQPYMTTPAVARVRAHICSFMLWDRDTIAIIVIYYSSYINLVESPCTVDSTSSNLRRLPWPVFWLYLCPGTLIPHSTLGCN